MWLLDSDDQPLALIDSAPAASDIKQDQSLAWNPGIDCRKTFTSSTANNPGIEHGCENAVANYLAEYINALAGDIPAAQLFERQPDGQGSGLAGVGITPVLENRILKDGAFPGLTLKDTEHDSLHSQLIDDFFCWQAPWLLLLHDLDLETRREFEQHARAQPLKIARQYQLYPDIVDRETIDAARVEARLRESVPEKPPEDVSLPSFYIELSPEAAD